MTEEEKEKIVRRYIELFDKALLAFMTQAGPPGQQYVVVIGGDNKFGAICSNIDDREVMIEFLTVALSKL